MNKYKQFSEFLISADISSIYKGKGDKHDLENDHGIFLMNIIYNMYMNLIYNEEYETLDSNMSDSNVGGRRRRSIRDHLFIINGIINEANRRKKNIDIQILD